MTLREYEISRLLKISVHCIRQTFCKFNEFHTAITKLCAGRPPKATHRE